MSRLRPASERYAIKITICKMPSNKRSARSESMESARKRSDAVTAGMMLKSAMTKTSVRTTVTAESARSPRDEVVPTDAWPEESSALRRSQRLPRTSVSTRITTPRAIGSFAARFRSTPFGSGSVVVRMLPSGTRIATPICAGPRIRIPSTSACPPYATLRAGAARFASANARRCDARRTTTPQWRRTEISASARGASGIAPPDLRCPTGSASP